MLGELLRILKVK